MGQITTTLRINTTSAQGSLNAIINRIQKINELTGQMGKNISFSGATFQTIGNQTNHFTKQVERATNSTKKMKEQVSQSKTWADRLAQSAQNAANKFGHAKNNASHLGSTLKRLAGTYLGVMGGKIAVNSADTLTSASNKFNALGIDPTSTMDKIYSSSLASYSGYGENMSNVAKMMTNAGKAFNDNVDNAIRFNEIMNKSYVLGGASAQEQASSMYQMIQALGSGILQGDELRSVREGAPQAYKAIEEFAQGVYGANESLKEMASQGKITSDMVVAAMMNAGDEIDAKFKDMDMTFGQLWTNFKTQALKAFQPVLEKMREFMNSDKFKTFVNNVVVMLVNIATVVGWIFEQLVSVFNWAADNWSWLAPVLTIILSFLIAYHVINGIINIGLAITQSALWGVFTAESACLLPLLLIFAVVVAIIALFLLFPDVVAGVAAFIAAVLVDAILIVWTIIVYILYAIVDLIVSAVQGIVLIVIGIAQVITNIVLGIYNVIITIVAAIAGAIAALGAGCDAVAFNIGAFFSNGFHNAMAAGLEFCATVMEALLKLISVINSVLGVFGIEIPVDWLEGAITDLRGRAESHKSKVVDYKDVGAAIKSGYNTTYSAIKGKASANIAKVNSGFDKAYSAVNNTADSVRGSVRGVADSVTPDQLYNPMDWYDSGAKWGEGVKEKLNVADSLSDANMLDTFGADGSMIPADTAADYLANMQDPLNDAAKGAGGSAANTKKMADSMDLLTDELEYLRDIAEQEIINRYTAVHFDVGGINNEYTGDGSLDGIVTHISAQLREALEVSAAGVHA